MERISFNEVPKGMVSTLFTTEEYLKQTQLDVKLLELMRLRVSQINGCPYCLDMHYKLLKHVGETDLRISLLPAWRDSVYFDDKEQAVLAFAEALTTINNSEVSDEIYQNLGKHFSSEEVCQLALAVSQQNTWNRLVRTFHFEEGHFKVPEEVASAV